MVGSVYIRQEYGMTQEEASQSVGKSRPAIANALRLLSLSPPVLAMVEDGDISAGHARALLSIRDEAAQLRAATRVCEEGLSVRQTEKLATKASEELDATFPDRTASLSGVISINYLAETEKQLTTALGRKVIIRDNTRKGRIELEFYGSDDREALIEALLNSVGSKGGVI